ncbi:MAG: ArsR family transcriptional regulator [Candidatus Thermoplasmatota archaeon]|nr:ArsR family transcriptional regulator [Candidatus Thermoplasmatota archaeon]
MAESRRLLIATLAGLVIFSLIPHSNAETVEPTEIEIHLNALEDYYLSGDEITFSPNLYNPSDTIQIDNNPSCDYTFDVYDINNLNIYSSSDNCRNQVQSLQLHSGEQLNLMAHTWDFLDNSGLEIASGTYQVTITHSILDISDTSTFNYLAASTIPNDIELRYNLVDISSNSSSAYLLQMFLHNPTPYPLDVNNLDCTLVLNNEIHQQIFENCLHDIEILHQYEYHSVSNFVLDAHWLTNSNETKIELLGDVHNRNVVIREAIQTVSNNDSSMIRLDVSELDFQVVTNNGNRSLSILAKYNPADNLEVNECEMEIYIINDFGEVVEIEMVDYCQRSAESVPVAEDEFLIEIYEWELVDDQDCLVDFGKYTIVLGSQQYSSIDFFQNLPDVTAKCNDKTFDVEVNSELVDSSLYTSLQIFSDERLRVYSDCTVIIGVAIDSSNQIQHTEEFCNYNVGNYLLSPNKIYNMQQKFILPLESPTTDSISVNYKLNFEYTSTYYDKISTHSGNKIVNQALVRDISGVWNLVDFDNVQCWMISAPNSAYILQENSLASIWSPKQDWYGEYTVTEQPLDNGLCSQFGLPVVIVNNVYMEESPFVDNEPATTSDQGGSESISIAEVGVIGVASSSILLGFLIFVSNTESLRIPVTSAGLWMLALVGKTHETSDGRFQRGRLIGYLTANPGCHFRALMAALNMSNGQITHHLRLLENQELIWRINDGRFVRYYPLNNSLYPGMNPDDLPVPPLSPDPRSLQGKILTILDDEHQLGEFPTQAELAKKLEKSQQLISHHLRTLQKYGLVEKRKMGIKNRYKLTKEALFLLETDIEYLKVRD